MVKLKKCHKCNQELVLSSFSRHPTTADGFLNKCKPCARKDSIKNRNENKEYYREFDRKRAMLPHRVAARKEYADNNRETIRAIKKKWIDNNPLKRKAQHAVNNAIRDGKIARMSCHCGKKAHAHHEDYSKPLDVVWLCPKHHKDRHKEIDNR